jgi:hypothetical protein
MTRLCAIARHWGRVAVICGGALLCTDVPRAADTAASAPVAVASAAFLVTVTTASGVAAGAGKPASALDETTKTVLTVVLTALLGVVTAWVTAYFKLRQDRDVDREKQRENVRLKVLNPLLISAEDLLDRFVDIARRRKNDAKRPEMIRWFLEAKERPQRDPAGFARWCNDEGYFALSTLYVTALYFHYAGTIRRDFPFFDLAGGDEGALLSHLSEIRVAIGGKFGIWEVMQDSLGDYAVKENGSIKNYREFCEMLVDDKQAPWLGRLLDFYRDVHLKLDDQFDNVERSLKALIGFLRASMRIQPVTYALSADALVRLGTRDVPPELIPRLQPLVGRPPQDEIRFVAAVVRAIGQDAADDYKPSILNCARQGAAAA